MTDRTGHEDHEIRLDKTEARQGRRGLPVLYVVVAGTVLAFIALGLLYLFFY
jgi:hypothetical protein